MLKNSNLKITEFKSLRSSSGSVVELDWDTAARKLGVPYSSPLTREQFMSMDKEAQTAEKEKSRAAIWGESIDGRRKKASVPFRCALSLDYDEPPTDIVDKIASALEGVSYVIYSTIKSTEGAPRVRVIIPTDRLINDDEHDAIGRLICGRIGMQGADPSCLQNWRMMLYPACLKGQKFIYRYNQAPLLSVNDWLGKYADWKDISQRPRFDGEKVKVKKAKEKIQRLQETGIPLTASDPRDKSGIVGAFCTAYSISEAIKTFLPDIYEEGDNGRYTYIHSSSKNGVAIINNLLCYSFHATDPAGMKMLNSYDLVRIHKFGNRDKEDKSYTDITRQPSNVAMASFAKADKKVSEIFRKKQAEKLQTNVTEEEKRLAVSLGFADLPPTDMGTAKRLAAYCGDRVKYDKDKGVWFRYRDGVWIKEADSSFLYEIIEKVADMTMESWVESGIELDNKKEKYQEYAGTNRNQKSIINCLQALIGVNSNEFDAEDDFANFKDGYMDMSSGELVEHSPDQMCRLQANAEIKGEIDAECISFIEDILPDEETRDYVQRLCGYLLGRNNEQKLVIFYGELGNNGKSTFVNLIKNAMGTYAKTGKIDSLLTAKNDGDPERANPSLAMLQNSRAVFMHENDYNRVLRSAEVKRITGNTPVVARLLRENFVEFIPKFTCLIDVNDTPQLQDSGDDAMKKRVRIIPFKRFFSGTEVDRTIEEKVKTQEWMNAYMLWALDGRKKYLERGLDNYDGHMSLTASNLPPEIKQEMANYFEDSDDIGEYITACLDITNDKNDFVTVKELYSDYCNWVAGTERSYSVFARQIKKRLRVRFEIEQDKLRNEDKIQERGYKGIQLLSNNKPRFRFF